MLSPVTLTGDLVTLEPLGPEHHVALVAAASDGMLGEHRYTAVPSPEGMAADIESRLAMQAAGTMLPFVVRRLSDGVVVGETGWRAVRRGPRYRPDRAAA